MRLNLWQKLKTTTTKLKGIIGLAIVVKGKVLIAEVIPLPFRVHNRVHDFRFEKLDLWIALL